MGDAVDTSGKMASLSSYLGPRGPSGLQGPAQQQNAQNWEWLTMSL